MGVSYSTLCEWKDHRFPEILEALKKGKAPVDIEVENALLKRATGYTVTIKKPIKVKTEEKPEKQPSFYKMVELALNESLGRKITVTKNKNKEGGVLQIEFYSDEELKELSNLLHKEQDND